MLRKNEIITALLEHEAKTDAISDNGYTPYDYDHYHIKLIDVANPFNPFYCMFKGIFAIFNVFKVVPFV
jgi:hypothetical protein